MGWVCCTCGDPNNPIFRHCVWCPHDRCPDCNWNYRHPGAGSNTQRPLALAPRVNMEEKDEGMVGLEVKTHVVESGEGIEKEEHDGAGE